MKREIKFKAKRVDNGEWVEGDLCRNNGEAFICSEDHADSADSYYNNVVDPETVCQFTGLTDKNGKEVYEGDSYMVNETTYYIFYKYGAFVGGVNFDISIPLMWEHDDLEEDSLTYLDGLDWVEVTGNIHDKNDKDEI